MARTATKAFNSIVLIGLAVFLAVGLTMVLPDRSGHELVPPQVRTSVYPALQAAGVTVPR